MTTLGPESRGNCDISPSVTIISITMTNSDEVVHNKLASLNVEKKEKVIDRCDTIDDASDQNRSVTIINVRLKGSIVENIDRPRV